MNPVSTPSPAHPSQRTVPLTRPNRPSRRVRVRARRLLPLLALWLLLALTGHAHAQGEPGSATVVVQFGEQDVTVREIALDAPVDGFQALELAGLTYGAATFEFGRALCSIEGVGCPTDDCFCSDGAWTYVHWAGDAWANRDTGPDDASVDVGDVEGWRWASTFGEVPKAYGRLEAASRGLNWAAGQQSEEDGGYGQSAAGAVETLLAISANNLDADAWRRSAASPHLTSFLQGTVMYYAQNSAAAAGKLGVALAAGGLCRPLGTWTPATYYDAANGFYTEGSGPAAWALLGALALGEAVPPAAVEHLRGLVQANGGWEWSPGWGTDTNSTALAIQALIAAGEPATSPLIVNGLAYLEGAQNDDGGFAYDPQSTIDTSSDTNSTAYVTQALIAAGEDEQGATWTRSGNTPVDFLMSRQLPDGSFEWQAGAGVNLLATLQAIPALLGEAYPLQTGDVAACPGAYLPLLRVPEQ